MAIKFSADKKIAGKYNSEDMKPHESIAAIFSKGGGEYCKYLMLRHVKCNMVTFPIGKVKPDQDIVEALKEECKEEVDLTVSEYKELLQFKAEYEREKKKIPVKTHVFKVIKYTGTPKNMEPKKHTWMRWMTRKEIEEMTMKKADAVTAYFAWLDNQNKADINKPNVKVGG